MPSPNDTAQIQHACSFCSPFHPRRKWTGPNRAWRASTVSSAVSTGSRREISNAPASESSAAGDADKHILRTLHKTIKQITEDFDTRWHFNTSIAAMMELVNELYAEEARLSGAVLVEVIEKLALVLGPLAPIWRRSCGRNRARVWPVFKQPWPCFDAELAQEEHAQIVVQVNGKLRAHLAAPFGTPEELLRQRASGRAQRAAIRQW